MNTSSFPGLITYVAFAGPICVGALCAVAALYLLGPALLPTMERYFYGRPRIGLSFFTGRLWFYAIASGAVWVGGTTLGGILENAYLASIAAHAQNTMNIVERAFAQSDVLTPEIQEALRIKLIAGELGGLPIGAARQIIEAAGATILVCLARISSVAYHPILMRSIVLALMTLFVSGVMTSLLAGNAVVTLVLEARPSIEEMAMTLPCAALLALLCGMGTELLLLRFPQYWGLNVGERVPVEAVYKCIICNRDATVTPDPGNADVGTLDKCPSPHKAARGRGAILHNFRRRTAGW